MNSSIPPATYTYLQATHTPSPHPMLALGTVGARLHRPRQAPPRALSVVARQFVVLELPHPSASPHRGVASSGPLDERPR
jgi:hypothetical protein